MREVMGSIGHLTKTCSCYGGTSNDPPGMTRRQSALAVWEWIQKHGVPDE